MLNTANSGSNSKHYFIKYDPKLKKDYGSHNAVLIVERLKFWFSKMPSGFYKFIEPCEHYLYKQGDSWSEETGICRKAFKKAFSHIGVYYLSKSKFHNTEDPFQGHRYASYYDRKHNQMFFVQNENFKQSKKIPAQKQDSKAQISSLYPRVKKIIVSKNLSLNLPNTGRSWKGLSGRSFTRDNILPQAHTRSFNNSIHKNTSISYEERKEISQKNILEKEIGQQMLDIWKERVGETGLFYFSATLCLNLSQALQEEFQGNLSEWEQYCLTIASSKFLMGETQIKSFKKAYILWAIKPENIHKIRNEGFSLGDREIPKPKEYEEISSQISSLEAQEFQLRGQLGSLEETIDRERRMAVSKKTDDLGVEELKTYKQAYEAEREKNRDPLVKVHRQHPADLQREEGIFRYSYVYHKLADEHFGKTLEEMVKEQDHKLRGEWQKLVERKKRLQEELKTYEGPQPILPMTRLRSSKTDQINEREEGIEKAINNRMIQTPSIAEVTDLGLRENEEKTKAFDEIVDSTDRPLTQQLKLWSLRILGVDIYQSWFKDTLLEKERESKYVIYTQSRFIRDYITTNYQDKIQEYLRQTDGDDTVSLTIEEGRGHTHAQVK